jgi:signal transduction histidine kinase
VVVVVDPTRKDRALKARHANGELKELTDMRAQLVAIAAHDVRSPLASILLGLDVLIEEEDGGERARIGHEMIAAGRRVQRELEGLVRTSRTPARLRSTPFLLNDAARQALQATEHVFRNKHQTATLQIDAAAPVVRGDPDVAQHVIENFLTNASKFSLRGSSISIVVEKNRVSVVDSGLGMSPADQASVFGTGARPGTRPTDGEPTSGDGLRIAKQFVNAMKGDIGFTSQEKRGSTFFMSLPSDKPT